MKKKIPILLLALSPLLAHAQVQAANIGTCSLKTGATLYDLLKYLTCFINFAVIPFIFALAIASFVWGVVQYVINDTEEAKTKGRDFIIWGIIGIAVMVSVWGLTKVVGGTFGIQYAIPQTHVQ